MLILCWAAYACIYFGHVNLSVALPNIQSAFHVSRTDVALLGSLFSWCYAIGQLVNGSLGDKVSGRILIFIGLFATAVFNLLFGIISCFALLAVIWSLNGYFQSMLWGPMSRILSMWFPREKQSGVIVAISTSMVGGYVLSWGLASILLSVTGWQWVFLVPGIAIFLFSFVWVRFIRNRPEDFGLVSPATRQKLVSADGANDTQKVPLLRIIRETGLIYIVLACIAQGIIKDGISLWAPTFIAETQHLSIQSAALSVLLIPAFNFFGLLLAGWLNKKMRYNEINAIICLFVFSIAMTVCLLWLGRFGIFPALIFLGLSSASMYGANTLLIGVVPMNYLKYGKVSSIAGFLDFCAYLASGVTSLLTGVIISSPAGWNGVIVMWVVSAAAGLGSLFLSNRRQKREAVCAAP